MGQPAVDYQPSGFEVTGTLSHFVLSKVGLLSRPNIWIKDPAVCIHIRSKYHYYLFISFLPICLVNKSNLNIVFLSLIYFITVWGFYATVCTRLSPFFVEQDRKEGVLSPHKLSNPVTISNLTTSVYSWAGI